MSFYNFINLLEAGSVPPPATPPPEQSPPETEGTPPETEETPKEGDTEEVSDAPAKPVQPINVPVVDMWSVLNKFLQDNAGKKIKDY